MTLCIQIADLTDQRILALLRRHAARARSETALGSAHAFAPDDFQNPAITLWAVLEDGVPVGLGALQDLGGGHGELKSFYTEEYARGRGVASLIMTRIITAAREAGMTRLSLETGSWPYFAPAQAFYARHGFEVCGPFGSYIDDPNSVFMTRGL